MIGYYRTIPLRAVALVAAMVTVLGLFGQADAVGTANPAEDALPAMPVATLQPLAGEGYEQRRVFSGLVEARRESALGFERGGRLVAVHVEAGAGVEAGELLAALDTASLDAQRAEGVAALAQAEASLELARATLRRIQGVARAGAVSAQELDVAREQERVAAAALVLARRRLDSIDTELVKSRLHAPFAGTVVARRADEGRVVAAGEPVLALQSNESPQYRVGIAGEALDALRVGHSYRLSWQGREIEARLRAVLPLRTPLARTVEALFDAVGEADAVDGGAVPRPGDLITLSLSSHIREAGTWLPITALTEGERGLWSVFVAVPEADGHRLVRRTVEVLYQEGERVYVRGSLAPDDRVVSSGVQRVVPGQRVTLLPEPRVALQERGTGAGE